jgi:hypothetical protein
LIDERPGQHGGTARCYGSCRDMDHVTPRWFSGFAGYFMIGG